MFLFSGQKIKRGNPSAYDLRTTRKGKLTRILEHPLDLDLKWCMWKVILTITVLLKRLTLHDPHGSDVTLTHLTSRVFQNYCKFTLSVTLKMQAEESSLLIKRGNKIQWHVDFCKQSYIWTFTPILKTLVRKTPSLCYF